MGLGGGAVRKPPSSVTPKSSRQSGAVRRPLWLNPADVERVFREHTTDLNSTTAASGTRILAFDGKALKGSFDAFNDAKARQILSAFEQQEQQSRLHRSMYPGEIACAGA